MTAREPYLQGVTRISTGDLDGAVEAFHEALKADSQFYIAHLGLSQALDRQGKVDEAIVHANKAIELAPDDPLPHTSLSRLYQQKGMIPEAEAEMALSQRLQG